MILLQSDGTALIVRLCADCGCTFSFPAGPGPGRTYCDDCGPRRKREADRLRVLDIAGQQLRRRRP